MASVDISYKSEYTFNERITESTRVRLKYPDRLPIICEKIETYKNFMTFPELDKIKYLVPTNLTVGQFIFVIRKRMKLQPEQSIFLFVNNVIPASSALMSNLYNQYHDDDGFLYVKYSKENVFG